MEITGIIHSKQEVKQVNDKFKKLEFILKTDHTSQYPQFIPMQLSQDKTNLLDFFNPGDEIKCYINLKGRLFNGDKGEVAFLNLDVWKLEGIGEPKI